MVCGLCILTDYDPDMQETIYQFSVKNLKGEVVPLSNYDGKVLLIVNTASECGLTPQLEKLESLYKSFQSEGFEILAFPSNDFAGQEPLDGREIQTFCQRKFDTTFPIFEKIHVRGKKAHPLYQFLSDKSRNGRVNVAPWWNFHKYLISRDGMVRNYFFTFTSPNARRVKKAIQRLLRN